MTTTLSTNAAFAAAAGASRVPVGRGTAAYPWPVTPVYTSTHMFDHVASIDNSKPHPRWPEEPSP